MPKKRAPIQYAKPSTPTHPSLSTTGKDAAHSLITSTPSGGSVNERIQQLRISQGQSSSTNDSRTNTWVSPTVHPSVQHVLQIPDSPAPRPRSGLRIAGGRLRGLAGPRPPDSWLNRRSTLGFERSLCASRGKIEPLPGFDLPAKGSLMDQTLRCLAKVWEWHVGYDQYYLATLPVRYKALLLRYIALHSPEGINGSGLEVLFLGESDLEGATGADGFTHLDLATSTSHPLTVKELIRFFIKSITGAEALRPNNIPDDWDNPQISPSPSNIPKFASVTHLSLSHPNTNATWKPLLDLAPHLATLTHLSLAYWPLPCLLPNSKTAYTTTPQGTINYSPTGYYTLLDEDWTEAASCLRRLAKGTHSLEWLDLTGCLPWTRALGTDSFDWSTLWQALKLLKVGQGWMPGCLQERDRRAWQMVRDVGGWPNKELVEWAYTEKKILDVKSRIRDGVDKAVKKIAEAHEQDMPMGKMQASSVDQVGGMIGRDIDEWNHGFNHSPIEKRSGTRTKSLTIDQGWNEHEEWWIGDALTTVNELNR